MEDVIGYYTKLIYQHRKPYVAIKKNARLALDLNGIKAEIEKAKKYQSDITSENDGIEWAIKKHLKTPHRIDNHGPPKEQCTIF